ncbi:hypothetical protein D3C80_1482890 [compost metagenome]
MNEVHNLNCITRSINIREIGFQRFINKDMSAFAKPDSASEQKSCVRSNPNRQNDQICSQQAAVGKLYANTSVNGPEALDTL